MTKPPNYKFPESFTPAFPVLSFREKLTWPFSILSNARRNLFLLCRNPDNADCLRRVELSLKKLNQSNKSSENEYQQMIVKILTYLAWHSLKAGKLSNADDWISSIYKLRHDVNERVSLLWELMECRLLKQMDSDYTLLCSRFLSDKLVTWDKHNGAVLKVVKYLYEKQLRDICKSVLQKANRNLKQIAELKMAILLSECPDQFEKSDDAEKYTKLIDLSSMYYSKLLQVDAYIVFAQSAEWQSKYPEMRESASKALNLIPDNVRAQYWFERSRLHLVQSKSTDRIEIGNRLDRKNVLPIPMFERICLMLDFCRDEKLDDAEKLIKRIDLKDKSLNSPEVQLMIKLIRMSFTPLSAAGKDTVIRKSDLCRDLQNRVKNVPWTEVQIAYKELLIDRAYKNAYIRLEKKEIISETNAADIAHAARILDGSLRKEDDADTVKYSPYLAFMEKCIFSLLEPKGNPDSKTVSELDNELFNQEFAGIFNVFPDLTIVRKVLHFFLLLVNNNRDSLVNELKSFDMPETAPAWIHWLFTRVVLLSCDMHDFTIPEKHLKPGNPVIAFFTESWAVLHDSRAASKSRILESASKVLDSVAENVQDQNYPFDLPVELLSQIRESRKKSYRQYDPTHTGSVDKFSVNLGWLVDSACCLEIKIESHFAAARSSLANRKDRRNSPEDFLRIEDQLNDLCIISQLMWTPIIRYWIAVAMIHAGQDAEPILNSLLDSVKSNEARAQLTLLAIKNNDPEKAKSLVQQADLNVPSVRYAKALLHHRFGENEKAKELLQTQDAIMVLNGSPYSIVSERLLGAVSERTGDPDDAEKRYRGIIQRFPNDDVANARLGRLLFAKFYKSGDWGGICLESELHSCLEQSTPNVSWMAKYEDIFRIIAESTENLAKHINSRIKQKSFSDHCAECLVLLRRLLNESDSERAMQILSSIEPQENMSLERTRQILNSWALIVDLTNRFCDPDLSPDDVQEIEKSAVMKIDEQLELLKLVQENPDDNVINAWKSILTCSQQVIRNRSIEISDLSDLPLNGGKSPLGHIASLWSNDESRRSPAVDFLSRSMKSDTIRWEKIQRNMIGALLSKILAGENEYLQFYNELFPVLDDLPVDGRIVWLEAAHIWYRRRDWSELIDGALPACVEDMEYEDARLVMGMAYTHAALDIKDTRKAAAWIQIAKEMLTPLIPKTQGD
jgi:hypothetical protein